MFYYLPSSLLPSVLDYAICFRYMLLDGIDESRLFPGIDEDHVFNRQLSIEYLQNLPLLKPPVQIEKSDLYWVLINEDDACVDYILQDELRVQNWFSSNTNTRAVQWLVDHPNSIDMSLFCKNPHPLAIDYLLTHLDEIDWESFSSNPSDLAVDYLLTHTDRVSWDRMCQNIHPRAIQYLIDHPPLIHWHSFSQNPWIKRPVKDIVTHIQYESLLEYKS